MCGLAGIVRWNGLTAGDLDVREAMTRSLVHRGPDGEGRWQGPVAAIGYRRLILRDAAGGAQPRTCRDGRYTAAFNGELYDLHRWWGRLGLPAGATEIEVLLAAWASLGPACLAELEGMFAVALWDAVDEVLWLARDRLGVKPLWWAVAGGAVAFASEIGALRASGLVSRRADLDAVVDVLVAPCFSGVDRGPWADVRPLLPGHVLRVDRAGVEATPWWTWRAEEGEVTAAELRAALEEAVSRTLQADVPVGLLLSGGLDSSMIAALARPTAGRPAWLVRFEQDDAFDRGRSRIVTSSDAPHARALARELGLDLREVLVPRAGLAELLAEVVAADGALPAWEQQLAQHALFRAVAADGVRAVLVGDAADETHLGYRFLLDEEATADPGVIAHRFGGVPLRPAWRRDEGARLRGAVPGARWDTRTARLRATTALVVRRWLPRLLHNGDVHAMAHGVEARVPFADTRLLALAARVDPHRAWRGGVEKAHLREAAAGLLPEALRTRPKSALPKDPFAGGVWAGVVRQVVADRHPVVDAVVDLEAVTALAAGPGWDERGQAVLFRVAALGLWARAQDPVVPDGPAQ